MGGVTMDYNIEFNTILKELKSRLAEYGALNIELSDLLESSFDPGLYSEHIYLYRSSDDNLIYIQDQNDNTVGEISVADLRIILDNTASRMVRKKEQVLEIERFLSE